MGDAGHPHAAWRSPDQPRDGEIRLALADGTIVEYRSDGCHTFEAREAFLRRVRRDGTSMWSCAPAAPSGTANSDESLIGAFYAPESRVDPDDLTWGDAALAADDTHLYVAQFVRYASGAQLVALDLTTGDWSWGRTVFGLGTVFHSRYSNAVHVAVLDGCPVVFGDESGGRYIEAFKPDGTRLYTEVLPRNR